MGAPIFTEAELRRAMKVAVEFGWTVKICPRDKSMMLVPLDAEALPLQESDEWTGKPFGT